MSGTNDDLGLNFAGLSFEDLNADQVGAVRALIGYYKSQNAQQVVHTLAEEQEVPHAPAQEIDNSIPQQHLVSSQEVTPSPAPTQEIDVATHQQHPPAPAQKVDLATLQKELPPPAPAPTHTFELNVQTGYFVLMNNPSRPNTTVYKVNKSTEVKMIINVGQVVRLANSENQSIVFDGGSAHSSFLFHRPNFVWGNYQKTVNQSNLMTSVAGLDDPARNCHPTHCYWSNYTLVQAMN